MSLITTEVSELREAYRTLAKNCGIKIGDTVKILRSAKSHESGWANSWVGEDMDDQIGKTFTVSSLDSGEGFRLVGESYSWPWFILQRVPKTEVTVRQLHGGGGDEYATSPKMNRAQIGYNIEQLKKALTYLEDE